MVDGTDIKSFDFWCYNVLPLVYDDSLTYYEVICKLIEYVNNVIADLPKVMEILEHYNITLNELQTDVNKLEQELEDFKSGKNLGGIIDALGKWIDDNLQELVGKIAKFVTFGLTDDGYFFAYIPESWDTVIFSSITDYDDENYGSLVLEY